MFCCCWYSFYQGDWQNVLERVKIQSRPADMPFFFDENIYLYNIGRPCMCVFFRSNFNIITAFDETQMWRTNYYCYHLLSVSMFDVSLHLFIRWTIKFIIQYIITICIEYIDIFVITKRENDRWFIANATIVGRV